MIAAIDAGVALAFSAPVTAAVIGVIGVMWKRSGSEKPPNGGREFGQLVGEFHSFRDEARREFREIKTALKELSG